MELVAAIVILGAIAASALQLQANLRYDAQVAALEKIRIAMVANLTLAQTAWLVQAPGAAGTVRVNGLDIEVWPADTVVAGTPVPAGSPTATGMFRMLGCGATTTLVTTVAYDCPAFPGYLFESYASLAGFMWVWPARTGTRLASACGLGYWPGYVGSQVWGTGVGRHTGAAYYYYAPPVGGAC